MLLFSLIIILNFFEDLEGELKDLKNEHSYLKERLEGLTAEYEHKRREVSQLRVQVVSAQKKLDEDLAKLKPLVLSLYMLFMSAKFSL